MTFPSCIFLVFLALSTAVVIGRETWRFLPCFGKDVKGIERHSVQGGHFHEVLPAKAGRLQSPDGGLDEAQRGKVRWHTVAFPHREFARLMPGRRVYGWYGCEFDVPARLSGMDVLLDLGIIDDSDETFVNGTKVGGKGRIPDGSAWRVDRLYRVPFGTLSPSGNYMAVRVWSRWGLGGIVGPPVLKAALAPPDAHWEVAFAAGESISGLNAAETSDKAFALLAEGGALPWRRGRLPWKGYANWKEGRHFAAFRTEFALTDGEAPRLFDAPVVIDCGPVFDVAAFYLNGHRLGIVGRFPEDGQEAFTEAGQRARFIVPPDAWAADGNNELAAVVYRERGIGGLPGAPGILLCNPLADEEGASPDLQDLCSILLQSGMPRQAEALLEAEARRNGWNRLLLSAKAHCAFLRWLDGGRRDASSLDGVLAPMAELLDNYSKESPTQAAMQAFCAVLRFAERNAEATERVRQRFPKFGKVCRMLPPDRATRGDWPLFYGSAQTILPAYGKLSELVHPLGDQKLYKVATDDSDDIARRWQPRMAALVADADAHVLPPSQRPVEWEDARCPLEYWRNGRLFPDIAMRRAAWWDDHGEMHPFDDAGPDLTTLLGRPIEAGQMLSLHLGDFDWKRTLHPRQQSILLFDDAGEFLDACWSGKSDTGVYERFVFLEETRVRFKVVKHRGACVALSGVFLDAPGAIAEEEPDAPAGHPVAQKAREALSLASEAERTHSLPSSVAEYRRLLSKTEDFDSVLWLARRLAASHGARPVWLVLAAGRLAELKGENPDDGRRRALAVLSEHCDFSSRVPFRSIFLNMAEE